MKRLLFVLYIIIYGAVSVAVAQTETAGQSGTLDSWADRLTRFGEAIPQEKVYLHMDNTSYFLGDTIWFAAYTRRTDKDLPSNISRVLYVELLNNDGFLVERQLIEMKNGRGYGNIALNDTALYAGYFELRAYTRWQLNWGAFEHPHTANAEQWFFTRGLAKEYYRDYDKLYSRVFPVYDRPKQSGEFFHDMTLRPLRRELKEDPDAAKPVLSCFPEGGRLVFGAECHVAFETATKEGMWLDGTLVIYDDGQPVASATTEHRGRSTVAFTPQEGHSYRALFTSSDTLRTGTAEVRLNDISANGVALHVDRQADDWTFSIQPRGIAAERSLGMTIMHEGVVERYQPATSCAIPSAELKQGVNQVTVFDSTGCVWADRLFFVSSDQHGRQLAVQGAKSVYEPYETVSLDLQGDSADAGTLISMAVRNATLQDYTYDSGTILTEMLLASEIRGFVPQPEWFFESDDDMHRRGLNLLMMTQGWRRFNWLTMATPKAFVLSHPAEYTQVLTGTVYRYEPKKKRDILREQDEALHDAFMTAGTTENAIESVGGSSGYARAQEEGVFSNDDLFADAVASSKQDIVPRGTFRVTGSVAREAYYENMGNLQHEVRVHAEFAQEGSQGIEGDVETRNGNFRINTPNIGGYCVFFLAASDTTEWAEGYQHRWVDAEEEEYPEFYVRLSFPYPRFVKPYDYYQAQIATAPEGMHLQDDFAWAAADAAKAHTLQEVQVHGRHTGLRHFDITKPAIVRDAYAAFNEVSDAGFMTAWFVGASDFIQYISRNYIGDMNMERNYNLEERYDGHNSTFTHSPIVLNTYNYLYNLDRISVYTDYIPRLEGNRSYRQDNQPSVTVNLQRYPDEGQRMTYRDRRYILPGFTAPDEFYSPDYSRQTPPQPTDHRRTLYWNPALQLDASGSAHIQFYNGSRPSTLSISAEGQSATGQLLWK